MRKTKQKHNEPAQDYRPPVSGAVQAAPVCSAPTTPPPKAGRRARPAETALVALLLVIAIFLGLLAFSIGSLAGGVRGLFTPAAQRTNPPANTFSILSVVGTIQNAGADSLGINEPSYKHGATLAYIAKMAQDEGNRGLLLYMNTPGGGVYESDEVYRALIDYREQTDRPVWVYMGQSCASGGYYISMAAQHLVANYNTTTGSIGVYIALTDTSGLYDMLGVETVLVRSGDNKGVGTEGVPITNSQRAVYQNIVDEHHARFVQLVMQGRNMSQSEVAALADGRPYTAQQAIDNGLIDELATWEETLEAFAQHTGADGFMPSFSQRTPLGTLLGALSDLLPKSDNQALLEWSEELPSGQPMAYAPGLGW